MKFNIFFFFSLFLFLSCSGSVDTQHLYGEWNYVKVVNADPEDITSDEELKQAKPVIFFSESQQLKIEWDGKQISAGKFKLDGKMIRYTETLEGGRTRDFPFLISKLTDTELVFQTMEKNYTRVTAIKKR
jgi:hypothetical protein